MVVAVTAADAKIGLWKHNESEVSEASSDAICPTIVYDMRAGLPLVVVRTRPRSRTGLSVSFTFYLLCIR